MYVAECPSYLSSPFSSISRTGKKPPFRGATPWLSRCTSTSAVIVFGAVPSSATVPVTRTMVFAFGGAAAGGKTT